MPCKCLSDIFYAFLSLSSAFDALSVPHFGVRFSASWGPVGAFDACVKPF